MYLLENNKNTLFERKIIFVKKDILQNVLENIFQIFLLSGISKTSIFTVNDILH